MMTALAFGGLFSGPAAYCTSKKRYGFAVWFGLFAVAEFILLGASLCK